MEAVIENFQKAFTPGQDLLLNEFMIGFKGRFIYLYLFWQTVRLLCLQLEFIHRYMNLLGMCSFSTEMASELA